MELGRIRRKLPWYLVLFLLIPYLTIISNPEFAHAVANPAVLIDPGNSSSYSGTGNSVSSIGTSSMTGTMSNVTYSASNGGKFTFDGSSSKIAFNSWDFTNTFTVTAWVKPVTTSDINTVISNATAGNSANGFKLEWNTWQNNDRKILTEAGNGTSGGAAITDSGVVTYGSWQEIGWVVNKSSGTTNMYLNGVLQTTTNNSINTTFATNLSWWIGSMYGSYYWMKADLGLLKIWNSNLTSADLLSEYNATQGRYAAVVAPTFTSNPASTSTTSGNTANFSATATTTDGGTISYQWQYSTDSGATWNSVSSGTGGTSSTYTTQSTAVSMSGYQFRVVATNTLSGGTQTTNSAIATLTVTKGTPTISLSIGVGSNTQITFRAVYNITINSTAPGKINLTANGRSISNCRALDITTSVICPYKSLTHGPITVFAILTPTSTADFNSVSKGPFYFTSINRTSPR
jgi:hypothetical protein